MDSDCVHYWKIEPPIGAESLGVCDRCGEDRSFSNRELPIRYAVGRPRKAAGVLARRGGWH